MKECLIFLKLNKCFLFLTDWMTLRVLTLFLNLLFKKFLFWDTVFGCVIVGLLNKVEVMIETKKEICNRFTLKAHSFCRLNHSHGFNSYKYIKARLFFFFGGHLCSHSAVNMLGRIMNGLVQNEYAIYMGRYVVGNLRRSKSGKFIDDIYTCIFSGIVGNIIHTFGKYTIEGLLWVLTYKINQWNWTKFVFWITKLNSLNWFHDKVK